MPEALIYVLNLSPGACTDSTPLPTHSYFRIVGLIYKAHNTYAAGLRAARLRSIIKKIIGPVVKALTVPPKAYIFNTIDKIYL